MAGKIAIVVLVMSALFTSGKLRLCDGTHAEAAVTKKKAKKRSAALPQKRCTNI